MMNKVMIRIIFFVLLLSSCSVFTTLYDNNEYIQYIKMISLSEDAIKLCYSEDTDVLLEYISDIHDQTTFLVNYTKYFPENEEAYNISIDLNDMIYAMLYRYQTEETVSPVYCEIKLKLFADNVKKIALATSAKSRR